MPPPSACCTRLLLIVIVVEPLPKPAPSMPRQPPPQFALLMLLLVTTPTNVPALAPLALPIVIPLEPVPKPSAAILFAIVLPVTDAVMLLVPVESTNTPVVLLTLQLLSVAFITDAPFDPSDTPLPNSLLNVHVPAPFVTLTVTFAVAYDCTCTPSESAGVVIVTLSIVLLLMVMFAVPLLLVMKTSWPKSLSCKCEPLIVLVPRTFCRSTADWPVPALEPMLRTSLSVRWNAVTLLPTTPICELPSTKTVLSVSPLTFCANTGPLQVAFEPDETSATQPAATVVESPLKSMLFSVTLFEPMNSAPRALAF